MFAFTTSQSQQRYDQILHILPRNKMSPRPSRRTKTKWNEKCPGSLYISALTIRRHRKYTKYSNLIAMNDIICRPPGP